MILILRLYKLFLIIKFKQFCLTRLKTKFSKFCCNSLVKINTGVDSNGYGEFRKYCYDAFLHLRRHANLILNLFDLMVDSEIPDIAVESDKTVKKVCLQDLFIFS